MARTPRGSYGVPSAPSWLPTKTQSCPGSGAGITPLFMILLLLPAQGGGVHGAGLPGQFRDLHHGDPPDRRHQPHLDVLATCAQLPRSLITARSTSRSPGLIQVIGATGAAFQAAGRAPTLFARSPDSDPTVSPQRAGRQGSALSRGNRGAALSLRFQLRAVIRSSVPCPRHLDTVEACGRRAIGCDSRDSSGTGTPTPGMKGMFIPPPGERRRQGPDS